ncbi:MAG: hypothetical protein PF574_03450 [Candidatus Delongbacteria bacterium]|jgi:hypothetical protein|nr:hypothetical protein [Candidatus Delongbacteria bacterium]
MLFRNIFILLILILVASSFSKQSNSWLSEPIDKQLRTESRDDQLGFGRLFIPTMSKPDWEPTIKIYSSESIIHEDKRIGESIFLKPGNYTLVFGSSTDSYDQIQKRFTIYEQQTTIINPEWAGLLVNVINENLEKIRFGYEILHLSSGISVGTIYSREENDYEEIRSTWILPPGKYKLVKQGEPFNTIQNFTTFELKEGELSKITVVVNSLTNSFIGAGELDFLEDTKSIQKNWHNYLYIKGSFNLNHNNKVDELEPQTDLTFTGKVDNKFVYDKNPYYFKFTQYVEEQWTKPAGFDNLRISSDELNLVNTAIYYFTNVFGLYSEIDIDTKIFPGKYYDSELSINDTIILINNNGKPSNYYNTDAQIISESFTPFSLKEELGLNFSLIKSSSSNLYLRTGIGLFQDLNDNVYTYDTSNSTTETFIFNELENKYLTGLIFSAGADFHFLNNVTYYSKADFTYYLSDDKNYDLEWDNNLVFKLFKYISIDYNLNLSYNYEK